MKGATSKVLSTTIMLRYFNPRTREGCDFDFRLDVGHILLISIHAPVKGATKISSMLLFKIDISIHAPVKGATEERRDDMAKLQPFQSTHP